MLQSLGRSARDAQLARGECTEQHFNCSLLGGSGRGKPHVAIASGRGLGKRVRFVTAAGLVAPLEQRRFWPCACSIPSMPRQPLNSVPGSVLGPAFSLASCV